MDAAENESAAGSGKPDGANISSNTVILCNCAAPAAQANFAALFIARRYGLSIRLANVIAALADIGAVLS